MPSPLRVILLGAGAHGFPAYVKECFPPLIAAGRIAAVAIVEPDPAARARALESLGLPTERGFAALAPALDAVPADALVVASPYQVHEADCLLGASAGLHLFIEKPVCADLPACCRVERAVAEAGVKAAVNMSARFEAEKIAFLETLRSGVVGRPEYVFARLAWNHEPNARARAHLPHPYLVEGGVHFLDLLRACARGRPRRVHNLAWRSPGTIFTGYASTVVSIEFDCGLRAVLEGSWAVRATVGPWRDEYIRADGETGALLLDHRKLSRLHTPYGGIRPLVTEELPCVAEGPSGTAVLFGAFVDWVRGERPDHPTPLADNLDCMALLYAANASAETRQVVDVQDFLAAARADSGDGAKDLAAARV
jgi:predicted dehydrogenase